MLSRLLAASLLAAALVLPASAQVSKLERGLALQMLKDVKADLEQHYYDPTFRGVDINSRFADAAARVQAAASMNEVSDILAELLHELNDSHTRFLLPQRATRVDYGWQMRVIGDATYVVDVNSESDAAKKGLQAGDRVLRLNRYEPGRGNLWWLRYYYRAVRPQSMQRVTVRRPDGTERVYDIASRVWRRETVQADDLEFDIYDVVAWQRERDETRAIGKDILIWRLPGFGDKERIEQAVKQARGFKALIIDLRGNGGGAVATLDRLVSLTFDRQVTVCVEHMREKAVAEVAKPVQEPFAGKIVAIIDSDSASAAEIYSRVLQIEKRGVVIGDRSAGAVMTSRYFSHIAGIANFAVFGASVTVADVKMSDGGALEHVGVVPDESVLPTAADLQGGRDPVLSRAVALVGGALSPDAAGALFPKKKNAESE